MSLYEKIAKAEKLLKSKISVKPVVGIILGTGLGKFVNEIEITEEINYQDIPGFVNSTVESHAGKLIFGTVCGKDVVAMQGRFHYYEGYSSSEITFPVRVMKALGVKVLIVSNAAGGLNVNFEKSDIMIINDFISLFIPNPLIGENDERLGPRFPDMSNPFDANLIKEAEQAAIESAIQVKKGVYAAVTGPSLETRAEYRLLKMVGADAVGMSTVPEVITAVHSSMRVLGLTVITDLCLPDALEPLSLDEVIENAGKAEPKLVSIIKKVINKL